MSHNSLNPTIPLTFISMCLGTFSCMHGYYGMYFHNYRILEKFYVGELIDNELPVFPERRWGAHTALVWFKTSHLFIHSFSEFYEVLKRRVSKYFKDNNIVSLNIHHVIIMWLTWLHPPLQDPKIDYWMFLRYFVFFAAANLGWYGTVCEHRLQCCNKITNYFLVVRSTSMRTTFLPSQVL